MRIYKNDIIKASAISTGADNGRYNNCGGKI